jgi:hypothetical protein
MVAWGACAWGACSVHSGIQQLTGCVLYSLLQRRPLLGSCCSPAGSSCVVGAGNLQSGAVQMAATADALVISSLILVRTHVVGHKDVNMQRWVLLEHHLQVCPNPARVRLCCGHQRHNLG